MSYLTHLPRADAALGLGLATSGPRLCATMVSYLLSIIETQQRADEEALEVVGHDMGLEAIAPSNEGV